MTKDLPVSIDSKEFQMMLDDVPDYGTAYLIAYIDAFVSERVKEQKDKDARVCDKCSIDGSINDREYNTRGVGGTLRGAIDAAITAAQKEQKEDGK